MRVPRALPLGTRPRWCHLFTFTLTRQLVILLRLCSILSNSIQRQTSHAYRYQSPNSSLSSSYTHAPPPPQCYRPLLFTITSNSLAASSCLRAPLLPRLPAPARRQWLGASLPQTRTAYSRPHPVEGYKFRRSTERPSCCIHRRYMPRSVLVLPARRE